MLSSWVRKVILVVSLTSAVAITTTTEDSINVGADANNKSRSPEADAFNFTSIGQLIELAKERDEKICAVLRDELSSKTNEEVDKLITAYLKTSDAVCTFIYTCKLHKEQGKKCGPVVNGIGTCFPSTSSGRLATASCPYFFQNVYYDTSKNVTRLCEESGTWAKKADYSRCTMVENKTLCFAREIKNLTTEERMKIEEKCEIENYNINMIIMVGKGLSLISLIISFMLFWMLKSIRCWRNIIHWNLVASFILSIVVTLLYRSPAIISYEQRQANSAICRVMAAFISYAQATNYFWMFVEGLYLHMMVVMAYSYERIKLRVYNAIGWGLPVVLTLLWAVLKYIYENYDCWGSQEPKFVDYFFQIPIIILLLINGVILANVVRILFTKLRSGYASGGGIGGEAVQYTKAVKAAVFLFPLLGITYILFFMKPPDQVGGVAFLYFNMFLQSFQGFFVCLIYCFANHEIRRALAKKIDHWRWQFRWPCCFWQRKEGLKKSGSCASISRTNNTVVNVKHRESKEANYCECPKNQRESVGSSPLLLLEVHKEADNDVTDGDYAKQTAV